MDNQNVLVFFNPNDAGVAQKLLGIFSGLILEKVNNVRKLIFDLCLPQDLKICLISQFPPKNELLCIISSFYKNGPKNRCQSLSCVLNVQARRYLDLLTLVTLQPTTPSPPPPKKCEVKVGLLLRTPDSVAFRVLNVACRFDCQRLTFWPAIFKTFLHSHSKAF